MKEMTQLAQLYTGIETALRQAMAEGRNLTLREMMAVPDIARVVTGERQMRDSMRTLEKYEAVTKTRVNQKDRNGEIVAWVWKEGAVFDPVKVRPGRSKPKAVGHEAAALAKVPGPVKTLDYAAPNPNEVELVLNGIEIIAGVNPITGRIRIQIEAP